MEGKTWASVAAGTPIKGQARPAKAAVSSTKVDASSPTSTPPNAGATSTTSTSDSKLKTPKKKDNSSGSLKAGPAQAKAGPSSIRPSVSSSTSPSPSGSPSTSSTAPPSSASSAAPATSSQAPKSWKDALTATLSKKPIRPFQVVHPKRNLDDWAPPDPEERDPTVYYGAGPSKPKDPPPEPQSDRNKVDIGQLSAEKLARPSALQVVSRRFIYDEITIPDGPKKGEFTVRLENLDASVKAKDLRVLFASLSPLRIEMQSNYSAIVVLRDMASLSAALDLNGRKYAWRKLRVSLVEDRPTRKQNPLDLPELPTDMWAIIFSFLEEVPLFKRGTMWYPRLTQVSKTFRSTFYKRRYLRIAFAHNSSFHTGRDAFTAFEQDVRSLLPKFPNLESLIFSIHDASTHCRSRQNSQHTNFDLTILHSLAKPQLLSRLILAGACFFFGGDNGKRFDFSTYSSLAHLKVSAKWEYKSRITLPPSLISLDLNTHNVSWPAEVGMNFKELSALKYFGLGIDSALDIDTQDDDRKFINLKDVPSLTHIRARYRSSQFFSRPEWDFSKVTYFSTVTYADPQDRINLQDFANFSSLRELVIGVVGNAVYDKRPHGQLLLQNAAMLPHSLTKIAFIAQEPPSGETLCDFLEQAPSIESLAFIAPLWSSDAIIPSREMLTLSNGRNVELTYQNTRSHLEFQHPNETLDQTASFDWYLRNFRGSWH